MNTLDFRGVTFEAGNGPWLIGRQHGATSREHSKAYLDFFADVGTASLGYHSGEHQKALARLVTENIPLHAPNLYCFRERDRAAERLTRLTNMDKVFFCNSGTEAVEAAIKLARKFQHDNHRNSHVIFSYRHGFHGRTYGSLAAGDGPLHHREGFHPLPEGFAHFEEIDEIHKTAAAVILAPVFGNNDVRSYPEGWLKKLRDYTTKHGILLIFDEVQTGSGRTGNYTFAQKIGVDPDVITLAKGIGMGCPVGAMLAKADIADAFTPGSHFSTFGGNPLSCVFVNGMLDFLEQPLMLGTINVNGDLIKAELNAMGWPKNVRGEGMLIAFDIEKDGVDFSLKCLDEGLLIGAFRKGPGPVKITPPLNIGGSALREGFDKMDRAFKRME